MNLQKLKYKTNMLLTILLWFGLQCVGNAQDSLNSKQPTYGEFPHIEWKYTWPSPEKTQKKTFKDHLNATLFGITKPKLSTPVSVLALSPDEYWVLDQKNKGVFQIRKDAGEIPRPFLKTEFDLSSLVGICSGPNSSILITDSHSQKIYKLSPDHKKLTILNDSLLLDQPTGIAYSPVKKEIWVLETKAHCITVLDEYGHLIKKTGSRGTGAGEFNFPTHIWIDTRGYIYITDAMNFRIQVLNPEGEVFSVFGEAGDASGYLARPKGIASDSFGNIYIVDALSNMVQVFDIKGTFLYNFGGSGHENSRFWMPSGICIDKMNNIYIADTYNSRIQVFKLIYPESK